MRSLMPFAFHGFDEGVAVGAEAGEVLAGICEVRVRGEGIDVVDLRGGLGGATVTGEGIAAKRLCGADDGRHLFPPAGVADLRGAGQRGRLGAAPVVIAVGLPRQVRMRGAPATGRQGRTARGSTGRRGAGGHLEKR
jgi:hypothetical protein